MRAFVTVFAVIAVSPVAFAQGADEITPCDFGSIRGLGPMSIICSIVDEAEAMEAGRPIPPNPEYRVRPELELEPAVPIEGQAIDCTDPKNVDVCELPTRRNDYRNYKDWDRS
ncbi:MAG: hypothetical protein AAFN91_10295 [Pseudomonadota bacterium]